MNSKSEAPLSPNVILGPQIYFRCLFLKVRGLKYHACAQLMTGTIPELLGQGSPETAARNLPFYTHRGPRWCEFTGKLPQIQYIYIYIYIYPKGFAPCRRPPWWLVSRYSCVMLAGWWLLGFGVGVCFSLVFLALFRCCVLLVGGELLVVCGWLLVDSCLLFVSGCWFDYCCCCCFFVMSVVHRSSIFCWEYMRQLV